MKRGKTKRHVMRHAAQSATIAIMALALAFQPWFAFTAQADTYDDYDYGSSYYSYGSGRRLLSSTDTYDDGTKATSQYRYDEQGNITYRSETYPDGSKYTVERTYNGNTLLRETLYEYDADYKYSVTRSTESSDTGIHVFTKTEYGSGAVATKEEWYDIRGNCIKSVSSDSEGTSYQMESIYNEQDALVKSVTAYSDGSQDQRECRYDEMGELEQDITYKFDAVTGERRYVESTYGRSGDTTFLYSVEKISDGSGENTTETWHSSGVNDIVKIKNTYADGSQTTEEYLYDSDGNETYRSGTSSDGTTWKRETSTTDDGYKIVSSDNQGNTSSVMYHYDTQTGRQVREESAKNADGSSSYTKYVIRDGYLLESSENRTVSADGKEAYEEYLLESDGNYTRKNKTEDGTLSVIREDPEGNELSRIDTRQDGTKSEIVCEKRADGQPINRVEVYSDGSMDRIDYVYDEDGDEIQQTETRRNGVGAVTTTQYSGTDKADAIERAAFNNGCFIETVLKVFDQGAYQITVTYSGGDIAQEIIGETAERCYLKTIYRDGRAEESAVGSGDANSTELYNNLRQKFVDNYDSFINQAWSILPE